MTDYSSLNLTRLGWGLALPVFFLCAIGLASIHATELGDVSSTPSGPAAVAPRTAPHTALLRAIGPQTLRHGLFILTGLLMMAAAIVPAYQKIGRFAFPIYWLVILLLGLLVVGSYVALPFVPEVRKTHRWIGLGPLRIQPSEFMKIAIILALARYLRYRDNYREWHGLIAPFLLTLLPMVLILKQPDLGTLLMLLPVLFAMLFVAGARKGHLLLIIMLGVAIAPVFYAFGLQPYQKKRIQSLFRQTTSNEAWRMNQGYQLRQSKVALGTGGLTGKGYGEGTFVRYNLLPEKSNDFIFAVIGHQWGFLGCLLVLAAYGAIVLFGIEVATATNEPFGRLLAIGVIVMIVVQALLNIGMT
ncbi:MAG: FtsW/RodA/SpoVE family cell cycle protein, partial [Planctomycetes bacterium]|nr:FtsW/RodA/SpoVE family cell cycle protein [Planctomycetota bacterium]